MVLVLVLMGCGKSNTNLQVNMNALPNDVTVPNETDDWISQHFTEPWNIRVIYRFDRSKTNILRNVSPILAPQIKPVLETIEKVFIDPFIKTGGEAFGKKYFHKEWVLFGSPSYDNDNTSILGTSKNARTMVLYDLNSVNTSNSDQVKNYMHVIFHEFTHALNQTIPIPPIFMSIGGADYDPSWAKIYLPQANEKGFITPYAQSSYLEDFAETLSLMVVEGPIWYSNLLNSVGTSSTAYTRFKQKEALVQKYMLDNFNIDLYALQAEVRKQLKDGYKVVDPVDITEGFGFRLAQNRVNSITIDSAADHYTTYGASASFNKVYSNYKEALSKSDFHLKTLQFFFTGSNTMTFRVNFTYGTGTYLYAADYNFSFTLDPSKGDIHFAKTDIGSYGTNYTNGKSAGVIEPFEMYILPYLVNRQFKAAYLPTKITDKDPLYRTFAGFSVNGASDNYFYGPVTFK